MKHLISISFITVSVFTLLIFIIVPHHHHTGSACFVMELCEQDNTINDEHTHHHNDDAKESCIVESEFVISHFNDETKYKVSSGKDYNFNHIYPFPVYFFVADFLNFGIDGSLNEINYDECTSIYKSAEVNQFHGLRAPPATLS